MRNTDSTQVVWKHKTIRFWDAGWRGDRSKRPVDMAVRGQGRYLQHCVSTVGRAAALGAEVEPGHFVLQKCPFSGDLGLPNNIFEHLRTE